MEKELLEAYKVIFNELDFEIKKDMIIVSDEKVSLKICRDMIMDRYFMMSEISSLLLKEMCLHPMQQVD